MSQSLILLIAIGYVLTGLALFVGFARYNKAWYWGAIPSFLAALLVGWPIIVAVRIAAQCIEWFGAFAFWLAQASRRGDR